MIDPKYFLGATLEGQFRLVEHLGTGSYGWVYSADRLLAGMSIGAAALKLLRPADDAERAGVLREVSAMAQLSHERLLGFFHAGEVRDGAFAGCLYIAMELAEGTLEGRLRAPERPAASELLDVARDLARALVYLHGQGAVHRDVKPANVFRTASGWKLGDFGLVRAVAGSAVQASGRKGSLPYMAPEAVQGETAAVRAASIVATALSITDSSFPAALLMPATASRICFRSSVGSPVIPDER